MKNQELITLGGEDRLIGYSFIGVGILLSVISVIKSRRKEERSSVEMR